jgi:hypothetical protein
MFTVSPGLSILLLQEVQLVASATLVAAKVTATEAADTNTESNTGL